VQATYFSSIIPSINIAAKNKCYMKPQKEKRISKNVEEFDIDKFIKDKQEQTIALQKLLRALEKDQQTQLNNKID
jgi:hypothetical protein